MSSARLAGVTDVWMIAEVINGKAQPWFFDPTVMADRKLAFRREQDVWLRETSSRQS